MPQIDLQLIYKAFDGDEKAAVALVGVVVPQLRVFARFLCWAQAEDLIQETLLRMWQKRDTFDPRKASFMTWVRMLMHSIVIDQWRAAKRRPFVVWLDPDDPSSEPSGSDRPDMEATLKTDITAALLKLDVTKRTLVWLVDREGCTVREAALVVGLSETNANDHLRRGRCKLREILSLPVLRQTEAQ